MKHIEFASIAINNFGAITEAELAFDKLGNGVHFVKGQNLVKKRLGSNGAAKSTLFNALCWCLFGKTVQGTRGTDVVPWGTKLKPDVTVKVWVDDGVRSRAKLIRRSTASNGLWVNGKVVKQEAIDDILSMTYEIFLHTIVLGQGKDLFFDLGATAKMSILSQTLNLDRWDVMSKRAKERTMQFENDVTRIKRDLEVNRTAYDKEQTMLSDLKRREREWERARADKTDDLERQIKLLEKNLTQADKEWGTADLAYDRAETELRAAQAKLDECAYAALESANERARCRVELVSATRDIDKARAALKQFDGRCPTCGAEMSLKTSKKHEHGLNTDIAALEKAQVKAAAALKKATENKSMIDDAKTRAQEDVRTFRAGSNDAIDARTRAESKCEKLKAEIKALKANIKPDDEPNPFAELITRARKNIKTQYKTIAWLDSEHTKAERSRVRTHYWVQGFKNIRLHLLQETLDELQAVTNEMLPTVGLDGWQVIYAMERETKEGTTTTGLTVSIKVDDMPPVKWESWSGGEAQRLRVIGAIALSDVLLRHAGVTCDLMVLDEPTRHLSPEGIADTIDFLIERGRDHQIFYVDHAAIDDARFASVVTVTKRASGVTLAVQR